MPNIKDGWTAQDWQTVEDASRNLVYLAEYFSERVARGRESFTPVEIKANAAIGQRMLSQLN